MSSYILEALPGIHGILIGVGVAFFSAFAMYAYQRLQETKDELDKTLFEMEAFNIPTNYVLRSGSHKFIKDNGELDWDIEAKNLLQHVQVIYSNLDAEEKYGAPIDPAMKIQNNADVSTACSDLCTLLYHLFLKYPFSGKSGGQIEGVTEKLNNKKMPPFDKKRFEELGDRINYLNWCWNTGNRAFMVIAQRASEIDKKKVEDDTLRSFNESMNRTPDLSEPEREKIWVRHYQPRLDMKRIDYSQVISDSFKKIYMYQENVLPKIKELIKAYETYDGRFHVRKATLCAIKTFSFTFIFGVIAPMVLINLKQDYDLVWLSALPYFLLFITTFPYMFVVFKLYKKIEKFNFK